MDQSGQSCYFKPCAPCPDPLSKSRVQRICSIIKANKDIHRVGRHENLEYILENDNEAFISCHWSYVAIHVSTERLNLPSERLSNRPVNVDVPREKRSRRSQRPKLFNFKEDCLFCGEIYVMDVSCPLYRWTGGSSTGLSDMYAAFRQGNVSICRFLHCLTSPSHVSSIAKARMLTSPFMRICSHRSFQK